MKKAIIDLDDVLSLNAFLNMLNAFNNSNYKYEDIGCYYVEEILPPDKLNKYKDFFIKNNVYDYAEVAPYSKEVLMKLMLEYEVYICSDCYSEIHKDIISELVPRKCEFIKRNYPFISPKNFIFTHDKSLIESDLKIDDKIINLSNSNIKLLFDAYHNKDITFSTLEENGVLRVNNWKDIEIKVLKKTIYK